VVGLETNTPVLHALDPVGGRASLRPLLVVDSLRVGGAERYVVDLAIALRASGHRPVVACSVTGPLAEELERAVVPVSALLDRLVKRRVSVAYGQALRRLVRRGGFDVVHAHVYASEVAAAIATAGSGVPLVLTVHTEGPWRATHARAASRWAYARAAHVVGVSAAIRRQLEHDFGVPRDRASFVPPAIVPAGPAIAPAGPAIGPRRGRLTIGRVARLQPEKGIDVFLRAAARLAPRFQKLDFVVIGDGRLRPELESLASELGLEGRVRFLGERRDARDLIGRLDVLAVTSITDGSPLVVLEAMAAGVPVVASAVGGIPQQLRHEAEGLLVRPGDPDALAHALARLVEDERGRRMLGEAARRRAAREFSHAALVACMDAIYRSAQPAVLPRTPAIQPSV
jgi:glycosyltransferase involved in cell wall biosynthesis